MSDDDERHAEDLEQRSFVLADNEHFTEIDLSVIQHRVSIPRLPLAEVPITSARGFHESRIEEEGDPDTLESCRTVQAVVPGVFDNDGDDNFFVD